MPALAQGWQRWAAVALAVVAVAGPPLAPNDYWIGVMARICLYATLALGLNVVVGFAGLLDLGYVAFFGIGSYVYAFLASSHFGVHLPFPLAVLITTLAAALSGILIGAPTLRLDGDLTVTDGVLHRPGQAEPFVLHPELKTAIAGLTLRDGSLAIQRLAVSGTPHLPARAGAWSTASHVVTEAFVDSQRSEDGTYCFLPSQNLALWQTQWVESGGFNESFAAAAGG